MADTLFDTWEGDDSSLEGDFQRVLTKHGLTIEGLSEQHLAIFLVETLGALRTAKGSTSEFATSMFMMYKQLELGNGGRPQKYKNGPDKRQHTRAV